MREPCTLVGEMVNLSIDSMDLIYNMDSDAETHTAGATEVDEQPSMDISSPPEIAEGSGSAAVIQSNAGLIQNKLSSCC
jgi:hypothetical protein